jgi:hypothetical protein
VPLFLIEEKKDDTQMRFRKASDESEKSGSEELLKRVSRTGGRQVSFPPGDNASP